MSAVELCAIWLNMADDPSDRMDFEFVGSFSRDVESPARVETLAGGRRRVIRRAGLTRGWSVSLTACTREQIGWLEDRVGQTVCARDDRGHKVFGVFVSVPVSEHLYNEEGDVALSLTEITYSEAV